MHVLRSKSPHAIQPRRTNSTASGPSPKQSIAFGPAPTPADIARASDSAALPVGGPRQALTVALPVDDEAQLVTLRGPRNRVAVGDSILLYCTTSKPPQAALPNSFYFPALVLGALGATLLLMSACFAA